MFRFLFVEQLRGWKALIKNSYLIIIGIIISFVIVVSFVGNKLLSIRTAVNDHFVFVYAALIFLSLLNIFFKDSPGVTIKPALFHYMFNSVEFKKVKRYMVFKALLKDIIIAMIIGFLFGGFSICTLKKIAFFIVFFVSCSAIKWLQYNRFDIIKSILLFTAASTVLYLSESIVLLPVGMILCCFICYLAIKIKPDWGKYNDSIILSERIDAAGRHMRLAEMTQISTEKAAKGKNYFKLTSLSMNKKNAVICKASIGSLRAFKKLVLFWGIMAAVSILIVKVPYITENIFYGHKNISFLISAYILSGLYIGVIRSINDQFRSFVDKHKNGFFVPYSHKKIMTDYLKVCIALMTVISVIIGAVLSLGVVKILLSAVLVDAASLLLFYIMENKKISKCRNIIVIVMNFIVAFFLYKLF
ncbi:hypothetical protein [Ruminococcus flavefaciens]|uniref:hypothetical protein n=1 Tax=Ruminococcus flavefaciens TaxID=1265 RepID=UPI00048F4BFB|nr:hypothetical protein [Ruminococcus flavefaciens]